MCADSELFILLHNIKLCLTKMVYNVSSGSILLNFSNNLTQEPYFLEILVPPSANESWVVRTSSVTKTL